MKTIPTALGTHYESADTTVATAIKVTRTDGQIFGFTSHHTSVTIDGTVYDAGPGLDATSVVTASGLAVGSLELSTLDDGTVFSSLDILNGVWNNASFIIFRYNYVTPANGVDILLTGYFGEFQIKQGVIVAELRDLRQHLQQPVIDYSSKNCRARLGDSRCLKDLTNFTHNLSVVSVTSQTEFVGLVGSPVFADDYFGEGEIEWTSGMNIGIRSKVKSYSLAGACVLALPVYGEISPGDTYTAIAGCRKRLEDCRDKFDNVLNFIGEPHRRGLNNLTAGPV